MPDVFISYQRADARWAELLHERLQARGIDAWYDRRIGAGADWRDAIMAALDAAPVFVLLFSRAAQGSSEILKELAAATHKKKQIIPVRLEDVEPAGAFLYELASRNWVDAFAGAEAALDALAARLASGEAPPPATAAGRRTSAAMSRRTLIAAGAGAGVAALGAGAAWWRWGERAADTLQTLAILPFRSVGGDPALADAITDDTRRAVAGNPNLRVLGRATVEALVKQGLDPAGFLAKVGANWLLDGGVRRSGADVRIDVSLVRTLDGVETWSTRLGGKLDDIFQFQNRIAGEVEGRIRGRLAPNRGVRAENIATSGDAYALYAEAAAALRMRTQDGKARALELLDRVLGRDANYAPAWVLRSIATSLNAGFVPGETFPQTRARAEGYARHAIELAPNLAKGHAALALSQDLAPQTEAELRRAIALDPADSEAWLWLGNCYGQQNRLAASATAHREGIAIDPLWPQLVISGAHFLGLMNAVAEGEREIARVEQAGDPRLAGLARIVLYDGANRPGDAVRTAMALIRRFPDIREPALGRAGYPLRRVGYAVEAGSIYGAPPAAGQLLGGVLPEPADLAQMTASPAKFWETTYVNVPGARLLLAAGRGAEVVRLYRAVFASPHAMSEAVPFDAPFFSVAPYLAVALRRTGDAQGAADMLSEARARAPKTPERDYLGVAAAAEAKFRAAAGQPDAALDLLLKAESAGYLTDCVDLPVDLGTDPLFAPLGDRPAFAALRARYLKRFADERARAGPVVI